MLTNTVFTGDTDQGDMPQEIVGLLTAISIVSKRMAAKLTLLDQQIPPRKEEAHYEHTAPAARNADQGRTV